MDREEQGKHLECDQEISRLRAQIICLRTAFKHIHVSNRIDDRCKRCGLDLRDDIHLRMPTAKLYHIAVQRSQVLDNMKRKNLGPLIFDAHRGTAEQCLEADPREWITLEPCDNQTLSGECAGHDR